MFPICLCIPWVFHMVFPRLPWVSALTLARVTGSSQPRRVLHLAPSHGLCPESSSRRDSWWRRRVFIGVFRVYLKHSKTGVEPNGHFNIDMSRSACMFILWWEKSIEKPHFHLQRFQDNGTMHLYFEQFCWCFDSLYLLNTGLWHGTFSIFPYIRN